MGLLWRRRSELHSEQVAAIEDLAVNGRYLLIGPPGSGKTSILLHRGQYVRSVKVGHTNIRLITFARSLKEFIATNGDDRFPPNLIQTLREFFMGIFETYHVEPPDTKKVRGFSEANRMRAEAALDIVRSRPSKTAFELLLVDEVQDLSSEEVELIHLLAPRSMFSGDIRQRLFDASGAFEKLDELGYIIVELNYHFRISLPICSVADRILVNGDYRLQDWCRYAGPSPPAPSTTGALSREKQLQQMIALLDIQFDTYNDPEDLIGIVVPGKSDCDYVSDQLDKIDKFRSKFGVHHSGIPNRRFDTEWKICIITLKSCKGLEFRAVHWLFADEDFYLQAEGAYTVVTRAKTSLNIYHSGPLKPFLAGAFPSGGGGLFEDDE